MYIAGTYLTTSLVSTLKQEVYIFADASEKATSALAYLNAIHINKDTHIGLLLKKSNVAPKHGYIIPRAVYSCYGSLSLIHI